MMARTCFHTILMVALASLLMLVTSQPAWSREQMVISRLGISQALPYTYKVGATLGDSLALYDYLVSGNTLSIKRGIVTPNAQVSPIQPIYTFEAPTEWGEFSPYALCFEHKNGKLYSAFSIGERVLILFTDANGTSEHVITTLSMSLRVSSQFIIVNEQFAWFSPDNYPEGGPVKIYKIDIPSNTLQLFYSYDTGSYGSYGVYPLAGGYYLMVAEPESSAPDLLTNADQVLTTYPEHWWQYTDYYMYGYTASITSQLSLLAIGDGLERNQMWLMIVWVENNNLMSAGIPNSNPNPYSFGYIGSFIPHAEDSFSSIYGVGINNPPYLRDLTTFKNWQFTNGALQEVGGFPDLSQYPGACSYFRINADFRIAISDDGEGPQEFSLIDEQAQSIRSYSFNVGGIGGVYHSDDHFYLNGYDSRIHCFALEMSSSVPEGPVPVPNISLGISPNPCTGTAQITVELGKGSPVQISVYNLRGQKVQEIYQGRFDAGSHTLEWNARGMAPGVYFLKLESGDTATIRKFLIQR